jgi:hypothetical protein
MEWRAVTQCLLRLWSSAFHGLELLMNVAPRLVLPLLIVALTACAQVVPTPPSGEEKVSEKIRLDLSALDEDGLYGPPDGLRALSYELCIPARQEHAAEVRAIDPTIQVYRNSRGRIGCSNDQYLCVGSTHQPGFRAVLHRLAALDSVARIDPSYAE